MKLFAMLHSFQNWKNVMDGNFLKKVQLVATKINRKLNTCISTEVIVTGRDECHKKSSMTSAVL